MRTLLRRLKTRRTRTMLGTLAAMVVLLMGFQNCRSNIQVSEIASDPSVLSNGNGNADGGNNSAGNPIPGSPSPVPGGTTVGPNSTPNPSPTTGGTPMPGPMPAPAPTPANLPPPPANPFVPNNPNVALLPIQGEWASVAYEDNIVDPNAGDRDFNDAVFNYKIAEEYNTNNQLIRIFLEIRLREKISGNNHRLFLAFNGDPSAHLDNINYVSMPVFVGEANAKVTYADGTIAEVGSIRNRLLNVFRETSGKKGQVTKVEITISQPELNVNLASPKYVDYKKYRLILQNIISAQSRVGIDIAEINPTNEMLSNGNGYPFGFMIPTDWQAPAEGQLIDSAYQNFHLYREWLNGAQPGPMPDSVRNWYIN